MTTTNHPCIELLQVKCMPYSNNTSYYTCIMNRTMIFATADISLYERPCYTTSIAVIHLDATIIDTVFDFCIDHTTTNTTCYRIHRTSLVAFNGSSVVTVPHNTPRPRVIVYIIGLSKKSTRIITIDTNASKGVTIDNKTGIRTIVSGTIGHSHIAYQSSGTAFSAYHVRFPDTAA